MMRDHFLRSISMSMQQQGHQCTAQHPRTQLYWRQVADGHSYAMMVLGDSDLLFRFRFIFEFFTIVMENRVEYIAVAK